jgi:hypothetical protein
MGRNGQSGCTHQVDTENGDQRIADKVDKVDNDDQCKESHDIRFQDRSIVYLLYWLL